MLTARDILVASKNSAEALTQLYAIRKAADANFSYSYLCRETGIPSRGYWSDVQSGRRPLALRYIEPVSLFFEMRPLEGEFFRVMVLCDRAKHGAGRRQLRARFRKLRKILAAESRDTATIGRQDLLPLKLFCMFGLFQEAPTVEDFVAHLGEEARSEIIRNLQNLVETGYVRQEKDHYVAAKSAWMFPDRPEDSRVRHFVRSCIEDAAGEVDHWFEKTQQAHFQSTILSVKKTELPDALSKIRSRLFETVAELESTEADEIVHLNFQLYPAQPRFERHV